MKKRFRNLTGVTIRIVSPDSQTTIQTFPPEGPGLIIKTGEGADTREVIDGVPIIADTYFVRDGIPTNVEEDTFLIVLQSTFEENPGRQDLLWLKESARMALDPHMPMESDNQCLVGTRFHRYRKESE